MERETIKELALPCPAISSFSSSSSSPFSSSTSIATAKSVGSSATKMHPGSGLEATSASDVRGKKGRGAERRRKERGGEFDGCARKKEGLRIGTREKGLCERARVLQEEKEGNDGNETKIW
jgi:hypothetical protein